jgi:hypothetical protein
MAKYDSRQRGRFSHVGAPPRSGELGYVPVVRSKVVEDDDEWRDLKREGVDPTWNAEVSEPSDDALPLPDLEADGDELPLPDRVSSPEDVPIPTMTVGDADIPIPSMTVGDADLPLPDRGTSLGDGDLPLPQLGLSVADGELAPAGLSPHEEARLGVIRSPVPAPVSQPVALEAAERLRSEPVVRPGRVSAAAPATSWGAPSVHPRHSGVPAAGRASPGEAPQGGVVWGTGGTTRFSALPPANDVPARPSLEPPEDPFAQELDQVPTPLFAASPSPVPAASRSLASPASLAAPGSAPAAAPPSAPVVVSAPAASVPRPPAVRPPPPPPVPAVAARPSLTADETRYAQARSLLEAGRVDDGFALLEQLCAQQPDHEASRLLLLELCFRIPRASKVLAHAEWVMVRLIQLGRPADACDVYRRLRHAFTELALSERALLASIEAAERAGDAQVVIDAAKLLVHLFPESLYVARVLIRVAEHQAAAGRPDLARATFEYVVTHKPGDPVAQLARQRLVELGG